MPDPDPNAALPMDAEGTRVTPDPEDHPRQTPPTGDLRGERRDPDTVAGRARIGGDTGDDADVDNTSGNDGGSGTSGSRGGGPASDFSDQRG